MCRTRTEWEGNPERPLSGIARGVLAVGIWVALSITTAQAQSLDSAIVKLPAEIEYKGLPTAPQIATLFGDPAKAEVFVQRIKFPAGLKVMPHYHPDSPRTIVVLSGTLYFAFGEQWDETKFRAFPAGTFFTEPPKVAHYAWAKDGEVIVQLTGVGPTATVPIKAPVN